MIAMFRALLLLVMLGVPAVLRAEEKDSYAAIGYSSRTGEYWFDYGMSSEEEAMAALKKRAMDSLTIYVAKNCYISLAQSKDRKAFGCGQADTPLGAEAIALKECRKTAKTKVSVVLTLHTAQGIGGDTYSS